MRLYYPAAAIRWEGAITNKPVLPPGVVMETRLSHLRGARYAIWVTDPLDNGDTQTSDITRPHRHHRAPWRL